MCHFRSHFVYFSSFQAIFVDFSRMQTRIVVVGADHPDHLTTITAHN